MFHTFFFRYRVLRVNRDMNTAELIASLSTVLEVPTQAGKDGVGIHLDISQTVTAAFHNHLIQLVWLNRLSEPSGATELSLSGFPHVRWAIELGHPGLFLRLRTVAFLETVEVQLSCTEFCRTREAFATGAPQLAACHKGVDELCTYYTRMQYVGAVLKTLSANEGCFEASQTISKDDLDNMTGPDCFELIMEFASGIVGRNISYACLWGFINMFSRQVRSLLAEHNVIRSVCELRPGDRVQDHEFQR